MKQNYTLTLFITILLTFTNNLFSQKYTKMKIEIEKIINIPNFPSGSGIAYHDNIIYAIGDDSPYLYKIDKNFQIIDKIKLVDIEEEKFKDNRIKKKYKPDFETLELVSDNEIILFGSGSKSPQRDIFIRVDITDTTKIKKYNISEFYSYIKNNKLLSDSELNIEATAFHNNYLYLFNRSNNVIIRFKYNKFIEYLSGGIFPIIEFTKISLPNIDGIEAHFSGATTLNDKEIIFTASVEKTNNSYDDGEIVGSLVGIIDVSNFNQLKISNYEIISNRDVPFKVESITINPYISNKKLNLILITDDDKGNTELIKVAAIRK